jgi:hypothetical protein
MISIGGGLERFIPVVMVVERGNVTSAWFLSDVSVSQRPLLRCTVRQVKVIVKAKAVPLYAMEVLGGRGV